MRWKRELRRVRNIRVGIRERSEFKLVERKKIAHGVKPWGNCEIHEAPARGERPRRRHLPPPTGLCGTRPIPMARAMGYFLSPCGLEKRPCVLATYGLPHSSFGIRNPATFMSHTQLRIACGHSRNFWRRMR